MPNVPPKKLQLKKEQYENLKKWAEELKSGQYEQTSGFMYIDDGPHGFRYCCLGVACALYDKKYNKTTIPDMTEVETSTLPSEVENVYGLSSTRHNRFPAVIKALVSSPTQTIEASDICKLVEVHGEVITEIMLSSGFFARLNDELCWTFDQIGNFILNTVLPYSEIIDG